MNSVETLLVIIAIPILYIVLLFIFNFIEEYIKLKKQYEEDNEDWIFPLKIQYNTTKTLYYAWDIDDVFLGQSENLDDLLTIVGERWNIPYENIVIRSETELNEEQSTE